MKIEEIPSYEEQFPTIALPDEDSPKPKLRLFIAIIVTFFVAILIFIDQGLGLWPGGFYWILFALGILLSCLIIGFLFAVNDKRLASDEETWLEKYGDEIGWPIMILAFTIQFLFPQIRPFFLGAILGGSWFIVLWHHRKKRKEALMS
jgi:hypothetical protein